MSPTEPVADNSGVRLVPPAIYLAGLIGGYVLWWFLPLPVLPGLWGVAVRIVGALAFATGIVTMFSALEQMRQVGTTPVPFEPTTALALTGAYQYTRNPMYLGMALIQGGLACLGNALWPLVALVPVVWIIQTQVIAREEAYLERKFGAAYLEFKGRVRRWI